MALDDISALVDKAIIDIIEDAAFKRESKKAPIEVKFKATDVADKVMATLSRLGALKETTVRRQVYRRLDPTSFHQEKGKVKRKKGR